MNGIDGVRILKQRHPDLLILMSSVYDDDERVFDAICAGACGYLLKKTPPSRLLESIREAVAGGAPMTPEVARRVIRLFREIRPPERANYDLTPHETRLLKLFVEGHNYKTAATELGVSVNTINFHVRNIYEKLQVHSRSEAVAKALLNRLI
jgi:DNA-binding NarL/FixJ family response regulator